MLKKFSVVFLVLLVITQFAYKSRLGDVLFKPIVQISGYNIFTNEFKTFAILTGLIVLFTVIFLSDSFEKKQSPADKKFWYWGFLSVFAASIVTVTSVNPQGNLPWNKHNHYIEMAARSQKPVLYAKLPSTPDVIVFGSSISFLMPMDYFEKKWNLQAFNFSIDGGGIRDFVNLINWMQSARPDEKIPPVILVEISNPGLSVGGLRKTPLEQLPSVETLDQKIEISWAAFSNTLRLGQISDSVFTVVVVENGRWETVNALHNDGTITMKTEKMSGKHYQNLVENNAAIIDTMQTCNSLNEQGKHSMEKLVELSREYKFSLVIYRPPINEDLYKFSNYKPEKYATCSKLFDKFMEELAAKNANLFFRDLSQYEKISSKGKELYRDTHHLNSKGQIQLLDVLSEEISSAIGWAEENRR